MGAPGGLVGVRLHGTTWAGILDETGKSVNVLADVETFWADPSTSMAGSPRDIVDLAGTERVPPVPTTARVICMGLNYLRHVAEGSYKDEALPAHPTLFGRWASTLTVSGASIPVPPSEDGLDWEGEIVVWVGKTLVDAEPDAALDAVLGYSTFNDVTARTAQKLTSQWTLGKNADRSGPLGPMVPAEHVGDLRAGLRIETRLNGETVQSGNTNEMVYSVGDTLSFISKTMTLHPGDLLATGTPAGVGYSRVPPRLMQPGDTVEVDVEKLGVQTNTITT